MITSYFLLLVSYFPLVYRYKQYSIGYPYALNPIFLKSLSGEFQHTLSEP